jgi:Putative MetA-pathway of phenol degradation
VATGDCLAQRFWSIAFVTPAQNPLEPKIHAGLVGYYFRQINDDTGPGATLGGFRSRIAGIGPQIGFLFPVGDMDGYVNVKAYKEFAAEHRPEGWNAWLTFAISPRAPEATAPKPHSENIERGNQQKPSSEA